MLSGKLLVERNFNFGFLALVGGFEYYSGKGCELNEGKALPSFRSWAHDLFVCGMKK